MKICRRPCQNLYARLSEPYQKLNRGEEEMIYLKDHHEAIIDRDTWNKTQFELARRSSSKTEIKTFKQILV